MTSSQLLRARKVSRVVDAFIGDGGFKESIPRMLNDTGARPYELFKSLSVYVSDEGLENRLEKKEDQARILYTFAKALYGELSDAGKFEMLEDVIRTDLEDMISVEEIKRFEKQGWTINRKTE